MVRKIHLPERTGRYSRYRIFSAARKTCPRYSSALRSRDGQINARNYTLRWTNFFFFLSLSLPLPFARVLTSSPHSREKFRGVKLRYRASCHRDRETTERTEQCIAGVMSRRNAENSFRRLRQSSMRAYRSTDGEKSGRDSP